MCTCMYMHTCVYMCVRVYTCMYMHACIRVHMHMHSILLVLLLWRTLTNTDLIKFAASGQVVLSYTSSKGNKKPPTCSGNTTEDLHALSTMHFCSKTLLQVLATYTSLPATASTITTPKLTAARRGSEIFCCLFLEYGENVFLGTNSEKLF